MKKYLRARPFQTKSVIVKYIVEVKLNLTRALIGCFMVKRFITIKVDSYDKTLFVACLPKRFRFIPTKLETLQRPFCLAKSNGAKSLMLLILIFVRERNFERDTQRVCRAERFMKSRLGRKTQKRCSE